MMNLWLNLLKAFGIVLGGYLLLFAGIWAMLSLRFGPVRLADLGLKDVGPSQISLVGSILILTVLPFLAALGALYLSPKGRIYAAVGALSLMVAIWTWIGIQIFNAPLD